MILSMEAYSKPHSSMPTSAELLTGLFPLVMMIHQSPVTTLVSLGV